MVGPMERVRSRIVERVILKSDHKLVIKEELPKPDKRGQIAKQYLAEINALLAGTGETLPA